MTDQNNDELGELDDLEPLEAPKPKTKSKAKPKVEPKAEQNLDELKAQTKKVTMEFADDVSADDMQKTMDLALKMTKDNADRRSKISQGRKQYEDNGGRRWRAKVDSLVPGVKTFSMTVSHPKTDKPIMVQGMCGVVIEEGITQFMIDCLHRAHHNRTELVPNLDLRADQALEYKNVKVPHYRVEVYNEIENPKPLGTVGIRK